MRGRGEREREREREGEQVKGSRDAPLPLHFFFPQARRLSLLLSTQNMYLMYTLDAEGKRVYTLKVRGFVFRRQLGRGGEMRETERAGG